MNTDAVSRARTQLLQPAIDTVLESLVVVGDLAGAAGAGVLDLLPRQAATVVHEAADAVAGLVDLLPTVSQEVDALVAEVHAQRLSIEAVTAELEALDKQLGVLEASLGPVQGWSHQIGQLSSAVTNRLHPVPGDEAAR